MTVSLTGSDTVTLNNYVLTGLADGNCVELDFPNDIANLKTGKDGNAIYAVNQSGKQAEVKLRVIRGSADDTFLNNLYAQQAANLASFPLMIGQFIKKLGDGMGNVKSDIYNLSGGIFTKPVPAKTNVEGETEQSVAMYTFKFSNAPRALT